MKFIAALAAAAILSTSTIAAAAPIQAANPAAKLSVARAATRTTGQNRLAGESPALSVALFAGAVAGLVILLGVIGDDDSSDAADSN